MLLPIFEPVVALFRPSETASHGNRGMMGLRGDVCVNQFYSTFSNFLLLYREIIDFVHSSLTFGHVG